MTPLCTNWSTRGFHKDSPNFQYFRLNILFPKLKTQVSYLSRILYMHRQYFCLCLLVWFKKNAIIYPCKCFTTWAIWMSLYAWGNRLFIRHAETYVFIWPYCRSIYFYFVHAPQQAQSMSVFLVSFSALNTDCRKIYAKWIQTHIVRDNCQMYIVAPLPTELLVLCQGVHGIPLTKGQQLGVLICTLF